MLNVISEDYVGKWLCVRPTYGWGWNRLDDLSLLVEYESIQRAGDFSVFVQSFFFFGGGLRGITGRVREGDGIFGGYRVIAGTMHVGDYDLRGRLCIRWDLELGAGALSPEEWPRLTVDGPVLGGHGIVAESGAAIDDYYRANGWSLRRAT
jgi:hypothetical protein